MKEMKGVSYIEAMGNLPYISQETMPDIVYAVSTVSRYMQKPEHAETTR